MAKAKAGAQNKKKWITIGVVFVVAAIVLVVSLNVNFFPVS